MLDLIAAREAAVGKKEIARQKIEAAKRAAEEAKRIKANPPPQLVEMPQATGNAEVDCAAELDAVQAGFRARAKAEAGRFELATDSEYWACMCFQTREQKEAFLAALDILQYGDKYIDGQLVAKKLGVQLPAGNVPYKPDPKIDRDWASFVE